MNVHIVTCSRASRTEFSKTLLGRSLPYLGRRIKVHSRLENAGPNALGLAEIYNRFIAEPFRDACVVFVHDDVFINDWLIVDRLTEALQQFDVVGVAGNCRPDWSQPSWALSFDSDLRKTGWQASENLSGQVFHTQQEKLICSTYGDWPQSVKLLDGLFIAVRVSTLLENNLSFDPRFRFHCYDIDFCRMAATSGLRIGTWPIAVTHGSGGNFNTPEFRDAAKRYLSKWGPAQRHNKLLKEVEQLEGAL